MKKPTCLFICKLFYFFSSLHNITFYAFCQFLYLLLRLHEFYFFHLSLGYAINQCFSIALYLLPIVIYAFVNIETFVVIVFLNEAHGAYDCITIGTKYI